jgi:hypothetical protein
MKVFFSQLHRGVNVTRRLSHPFLSVNCLPRAVAALFEVAAKFNSNLFANKTIIHRLEERFSNPYALPAQSCVRVGDKVRPGLFVSVWGTHFKWGVVKPSFLR